MSRWRSSALAALTALLVACSSGTAGTAGPPRVAYDARSVSSGPVGDSIRLGREIVMNTQRVMPKNVKAAMSCAACHIDGGTVPRGGTFVGIYGRFPQWNVRSKRVIALQDRLAECFLYSMNGTPPAYSSKEMIGLVAYISYLSRNVPNGQPQPESDRFIVPLPSTPPDVHRGAALYTRKCQQCHAADGAGAGAPFPPLWGPTSFNNGAGMAHIDRIAGFIKYNMPQNAPNSLSMQDAYDVAAFVLSHERPRFDKHRAIQFPPEPASTF